MAAHFGSGDSGVFNIGDALLTGGLPDAIVNVSSAGWQFDRHGDGTYTVNIREDGQLSGTFQSFGSQPNRKWVVNVDGGSMTSTAAWNMSDGLGNDANYLNLAKGGTVNVGAITVHEEVIHFQDATSASFTAAYGASFANIAAVNAALGTTFTPSGARTLTATDNGTSFTVAIAPERIEIGGDNTIGELHLAGTQSNEVLAAASGRFVQVKNNGTDTRRMDLGEIEVFAPGVTPAVDNASGSGSLNPTIDLAYTGNGASNYAQGADSGFSQPHGTNTLGPINAAEDISGNTWSSQGVGNYITIDLGGTFDVGTVRVHQRNDSCCQDRLQNFSVNVFADDGTGNPGTLVDTKSYDGQPPDNLFGELGMGTLLSADLVAMLSDIDTYVFELGSSDQIIVDNPNPAVFTTVLDLNNTTIEVELLGPPHSGTWQLLVADEITGSYDSLILPALGSGWQWDSSNLLVNGSLSLVPEPSGMSSNRTRE